MIPLVLVTGFLGSGKTSLLRHWARTRGRTRRWLFLVNEFASVDLDSPVLRETGVEVISLPGGSIFCRCLVTSFLGQLRQIETAARQTPAPPEGVIIEASGMADPRVMQRMLEETGLQARFELFRVVAVADPARLLKLLHTLPAIRAQLESADLVVLNRTDLCAESVTAEAERRVSEIRPGARMLRSVRCEIEWDPFAGRAAPHTAGGDYARCRDPRFSTRVEPARGALDWASFRRALATCAEDVFRVKGYAVVGGQRCRVEYAGGEPTAVPAEEPGPDELVFILRGGGEAAVETALLLPLRSGRWPAA